LPTLQPRLDISILGPHKDTYTHTHTHLLLSTKTDLDLMKFGADRVVIPTGNECGGYNGNGAPCNNQEAFCWARVACAYALPIILASQSSKLGHLHGTGFLELLPFSGSPAY
jgi:hypothetical protein